MIVILKPATNAEAVTRLEALLREHGAEVSRSQAGQHPILSVDSPSPTTRVQIASLCKSCADVAAVVPTDHPYPLVASRGGEQTVRVGDIEFGGRGIVVMAGPCSVESEEQIHASAQIVAKAGAQVLRGGAFKPSTSPYGFSGVGRDALKWLRQAADVHGLLVVTEVMDPRKVDLVAEHADILQIGARNMQNFDLLREVGLSGHPVLLKRGLSARMEEWFLAAEHVAMAGSSKIILCERGIRTFESSTRNTLDVSAIPVAHSETCLPVAADPSHAAGRRDLVPALAKAAVAAGADALLIEVHPEPEKSIKDGAQSLSPDEFSLLMEDLRRVASALVRSLSPAESCAR